MKKFDLENRLIDFAGIIIDLSESLPQSLAGRHLCFQLLRSGTSPALHYGEAQAAESRSDFIHKMKICLKELRETYNCVRVIGRRSWIDSGYIKKVEEESYELISIFVRSIITAKQNQFKAASSTRQIQK